MAIFLLMGLEHFPDQNKVIRRPGFDNLAQQSGHKNARPEGIPQWYTTCQISSVYLFIYFILFQNYDGSLTVVYILK